jgi:predicted RNase H-like HicB family nuclease
LIQIKAALPAASAEFPQGGNRTMLQACYWAQIERAPGNQYAGRVPDLPEISSVVDDTEAKVIEALSAAVRRQARASVLDGRRLPQPRRAEDLPPASGEEAHLRRILLIFGQ